MSGAQIGALLRRRVHDDASIGWYETDDAYPLRTFQWGADAPRGSILFLGGRGDFFEKMRGALARYGISPQQIEVEITENICIRNPQYAIEQLNKLCQLGVSIAIDDFGTGYSSLSYLHRFPIHTVKIDQSFVKEIHEEGGHYPVILAIISIARGLGLNLIAEGVETEEQARYLRANGCMTMQGYLYYRPIPLGEFIKSLRTQPTLFGLRAVQA